ncbi:AMIN domain-containing protein [Roseofilum sp. BLCC_M154]|uniref:AMIN domain-containing protein n=1 Tax=Roseofilum acuticapitatum BLCC-M154 TaxID=3022444 RepID=A0ABT7AUK8_9CYAN|nr:AMIN domain-containing protein [Roseofilum acuticapitatum]MDJ1170595.1 AMIN domain-containing protein [Roseofilum acuticapitatum BLCC-M154]
MFRIKVWVSQSQIRANLLGLIGAIALSSLGFPALAELRQWQYDPIKTELELILQGAIAPHYFILENPLRIIVELPDTQIQEPVEQNIYPGLIQQISLERLDTEKIRLILVLSPGVTLAPEGVAIASYPTSDGLYKTAIRPLIANPSSRSDLTLPPATFEPPANQPLVSVPPLFRRQSPPQTPDIQEPTPGASAASLVTQPASVETTPDLVGMRRRSQPQNLAPSSDIPPIGSTVIPEIQFGQDLPFSNTAIGIAQSPRSTVPRGTLLKLRYPGPKSLVLTPGIPLQEVLILHEAIADWPGGLRMPVGTRVIGQFETQGQYTRFQATTLVLGGDRTFPLQGQSDPLISPIIEPGQVIEVRLGG